VQSELHALIERCLSELDLKLKISDRQADIELTSCFGESQSANEGQTRILYLGENVRPNYSNIDYSLTFDLNNYEGRNIYLPIWMMRAKELSGKWIGGVNYDKNLISRKRNINNNGKIVYIGNNSTPMRRELIIRLRRAGYTVDEYGSHTNPIKDKIKTYSKYTYSLCLENSYSPNYVTEKLIDGYIGETIPIYWGGIDKSTFNHNAFIEIGMNEAVENFVVRFKETKYTDYKIEKLFKDDAYMKCLNKTKNSLMRLIGNLYSH